MSSRQMILGVTVVFVGVLVAAWLVERRWVQSFRDELNRYGTTTTTGDEIA